MSDIVPRNELAGQGVRGVVAIAGGIGAIALAGISGWWGIIIGGVLTVIGLALASPRKDRLGGVVIAAAGAAVFFSSLPVLGGIFKFLDWIMRAAGIVLIGIGGFSLFKFISGLRKRT
jgi:hypothetical protein